MRSYLLMAAMISCVLACPVDARAAEIKGLSIIDYPSTYESLPNMEKFFAKAARKESKGRSKNDAVLFTDEPFFSKVKFMVLPEPQSLSERVDRLLNGIYTDIPPEYDHYGYEIRRYMANVGSIEAYQSIETVKQQLQNVKNAEIILNYWHDTLRKEIEEIKTIIEESGDTSSLRTRFKYNRGVINAFIVESQNWIDRNKKLLEYMVEIGPRHFKADMKRQVIAFKLEDEVSKYARLYKNRLYALSEIRGYMPFRMMIY